MFRHLAVVVSSTNATRALSSASAHYCTPGSSRALATVAKPSKRRTVAKDSSVSSQDVEKPRRGPNKPGKKARELTASGVPKLSPYDLTQRLNKKCENGKLDEAYTELLSMPRDAMDVVTWNSMITYAMKATRYTMAFRIFNEMKRRAFTPNVRTYQALLGGFAAIPSWEGRSVTRATAEKVYASYEAYTARIKADEPDRVETEVSVAPVNHYLRCLSNMGEYQKMWDIFNALPIDGPGAADASTYTTLLVRLSQRHAPEDESREQDTEAVPLSATNTELKTYQRNGSDALLVWRMMLRSMQRRTDLELQEPPLLYTLQSLIRSPLEEHLEIAQDMMAKHLGLPANGDNIGKGDFPVSGEALHIILSSLVASRRYELCLHYGSLAMHNRSIRKILDVGHMEHMLAARAALARPIMSSPPGTTPQSQNALQIIDWMLAAEHDNLGSNAKPIIPRMTSYTLALRACWHAVDWPTACTLIERMTGINANAFLDDWVQPTPIHARSPGRTHTPDAESLANIMRTAMATSPAATRQALRMVSQFGSSYFTPYSIASTPVYHIRSVSRLAGLVVRGFNLLARDGDSKILGKAGAALYAACAGFIRSSASSYGPTKLQRQEDSQSTKKLFTRRVRLNVQPADDTEEFASAASKLRQEQTEAQRKDSIDLPWEKFESL